MIKSLKIRLKPNKFQEKQLYASANTARFVYNWTLNRQVENYKLGNKFLSDNDLRKELTKLKKLELSWLSEVSNNVAKQAVKDCCEAFKNFFNKKSAFPRFKSKRKTKPSFYNDNCKLKVKKNLVLIEKVGWIKTSEQLPETKFTNPRISFDGKYWYISVGIEYEKHKVELTGEIIGIDLGIKDLAIVSTGKVYKNINKSKKMKKLKKKLKRKQKQVCRKYEKGGSYHKTANILKLEKQIKLLHRKVLNVRTNHLHQVSSEIVKTKPSQIKIEDLNVAGMMKNSHLSRALQEQSFDKFFKFLTYKAEFLGIEIIKVYRFFPSSKTCHKCKIIKKDLKLSDRIYVCSCGYRADRDLNAALNLRDWQSSP